MSWPLVADAGELLRALARDRAGAASFPEFTIAAVAERRRILRVLTTDRRHFGALRVAPRLSQALELLP